ncbi:MAG: hypothetical protein R8G34_19855 [Paracoccaceae bacterium]|nr:hypothetical protein [Paracoccaceae bacterium]
MNVRPALMAACLIPAPLTAQSFDEAVWTNTSIAVQLCLQEHPSGAARAGAFRASGFAETVERSTTNADTTHVFTAPAQTVTAELYYGEMPQHCFVETRHLGVTGMSQMLDAIIPRLFPSYVRIADQGAVDPATGQPALCVRYEDPANPIGHVVGAATLDPTPNQTGCVDNGTSSLYSSYRV